MDDFTQMLKKGGGGGGDLEFALIDRRPRSCAGAPVKICWKKLFQEKISFNRKFEILFA